MTSNEIKALTGQYIMNTYGRFPVAIDHGQGATLYDPEGNEYIDFTSGIGVTDLGYGNEPWVDAITEQAKIRKSIFMNCVSMTTATAEKAAVLWVLPLSTP